MLRVMTNRYAVVYHVRFTLIRGMRVVEAKA